MSGEIESQLGYKRGALEGPASAWLDILHPLDRDRYAASLDGLLSLRGIVDNTEAEDDEAATTEEAF